MARQKTGTLRYLIMRRVFQRPSSHWVAAWVKDTGLILSSQLTVTAMTTVLTIVVARGLGPRDFGIFSGFVGLSQAFSLAVDVGVAAWLLRELSNTWADADVETARAMTSALLGDALGLNVVLGLPLVAGFVCAGLVLGLSGQLVLLLAALMAYVVALAAASSLETALRAQRQVGKVVVASALEKGTLVAAATATLSLGFGFLGLSISYVLAGVVRLAYSFAVTLGTRSGTRFPTRARVKAIARAALPFALNAAAFNFAPRLDMPLVTVISARAGSYFALAYQTVTAVVVIPVIASSTLYPFLAGRTGHALRDTTRVLGVAGLLCAVLGIALAPTAVPLLFGSEYEGAIGVTQCIFVALPFVFYANGLLVGLYTRERERSLLRATLPVAFTGSIAVAAGASIGGARGAALGYVFRYCMFTIVLIRMGRQNPG